MAPNTTSDNDPLSDPGHSRTLRNVLRAAYGTPLFLVQHGWRQRYVERNESDTVEFSEAMPPAEPATSGSVAQSRDNGCGPIVMRTFEVGIGQPKLTATELMDKFRRRSNDFVPQHIAGFLRDDSKVRSMALGDEFVVELPGPWNGPVRVDAVDDTAVLLVTLSGHMEAGHIRFAVVDDGGGSYLFQIRSWARAGDELFRQLHLVVGLAHEAQTAMWVHTCDRAVAVSGGTRQGEIRVATERLLDSQRDC